jgi:hypothetical protein
MSFWDDRPSAVTLVEDALSYDATVATSAMQAAESVVESCGTLRSKDSRGNNCFTHAPKRKAVTRNLPCG